MTGYGACEASRGGLYVSVDIKSVNSRYLDTTVNLPPVFRSLERPVENLVRNAVMRGKLYINVNLECPQSAFEIPEIDYSLVDHLFRIREELTARYNVEFSPDFSGIISIPGVFRMKEKPSSIDATGKLILSSVTKALKKLQQSRKEEARLILGDFRESMRSIRKSLRQIEDAMPRKIRKVTEDFQKRIERLAGDNSIIDPQRVAGEIAILIDRLDISEEVNRLKSHILQVDGCIREGGSVGKKLLFYLQEMNRESNTIGAKSNSAEISAHVVEIKTNLEKMREQAQNVE